MHETWQVMTRFVLTDGRDAMCTDELDACPICWFSGLFVSGILLRCDICNARRPVRSTPEHRFKVILLLSVPLMAYVLAAFLVFLSPLFFFFFLFFGLYESHSALCKGCPLVKAAVFNLCYY